MLNSGECGAGVDKLLWIYIGCEECGALRARRRKLSNLWQNDANSIFLTEIGPDEIYKIIKDLGINKSGDIYGNTSNLVKLGGPVLIQILTLLFNKSIDQGIFPSALKLSKIVPIHKGDSIFEVSNYRPISLLPIFSKILEKLMYSRIIDFITKHNVLYTNQFGFQKGMSTEYAINSLLHNVVHSMNNDETGFCILLDFAKAFDTVNHEILLDKLSILWDQRNCTEMVSKLSQG